MNSDIFVEFYSTLGPINRIKMLGEIKLPLIDECDKLSKLVLTLQLSSAHQWKT